MIKKYKIKKGDTVSILRGKDKGKNGKIIRVFKSEGKVMVEGINAKIRHTRKRRADQKGQRVTVYHPLWISNVAVICPSCAKRARIGYKTEGGIKTRVCKKCKADIA